MYPLVISHIYGEHFAKMLWPMDVRMISMMIYFLRKVIFQFATFNYQRVYIYIYIYSLIGYINQLIAYIAGRDPSWKSLWVPHWYQTVMVYHNLHVKMPLGGMHHFQTHPCTRTRGRQPFQPPAFLRLGWFAVFVSW